MFKVFNPFYLWGLLTLLIPIFIHLYNRQTNKIKILGNIRWLLEIKPGQSNFRRIYQWPLLLIRLLLISTIVFLLIDLTFQKKEKPTSKLKTLILIHPAVKDTIHLIQLAESWKNDSVQVRWLMPELPLVTEKKIKINYNQIWSLISEAEKKLKPDSIHVIAPNRANYFAGTPHPLNAALSFEFINTISDTGKLLQANIVNQNSELLWFESGSAATEYKIQNNLISDKTELKWIKEKNIIIVKSSDVNYTIPISIFDTLKINFIKDKKFEKQYKILKTIFKTLADYYHIPVLLLENSKKSNWLVLFNDSLPTKSNYDFKLLWKYKSVKGSNWLEMINTDTVLIRKEIKTGNIINGGLLTEMRPFFLDFKYKNVQKIPIDNRLQGEININGNLKNRLKNKLNPDQIYFYNYRVWFGVFALGLFALERLWPKQK